jgi:hypothetical protein
MANLLANGMAWLNDQLAEHVAVTMRFHRKGQSCEVRVIPRKPVTPPISPGGAPINPSIYERDLDVRLADLASVLGTTMPSSFDYFTEVVSGRTVVYKITQPIGGGPRFDWVNGDRGPEARILIHTKQTGVSTGEGGLKLGKQAVAGNGALS